MSPIIGTPTYVEINGVDLSGFVKDATFEPSPWQASVLDGFPSGSIALDFTSLWDTPRSYTFEVTWDQLAPETRAYFRRFFAEMRRRRLSRMRSAYRRKHR